MAISSSPPTVTIEEVATWPISGLDRLEGRYLIVDLPPGVRAPLHHHDGWQFIYVLEGAVISRMDGEPTARYAQGDAWYESRGQRHMFFANEGDRPAKVLVFFLSEPGTPVLAFD